MPSKGNTGAPRVHVEQAANLVLAVFGCGIQSTPGLLETHILL